MDRTTLGVLEHLFRTWMQNVMSANLPANTRDDYLRMSHQLLLKMWDELEKGDENASTEAA